LSASTSPPSCAEPRCSIWRDPRRVDHTICTAVAPEAVFTVRTYATSAPYEPRISVQISAQQRPNPQISALQLELAPKNVLSQDKWWRRYHKGGRASLTDRSSEPRGCPTKRPQGWNAVSSNCEINPAAWFAIWRSPSAPRIRVDPMLAQGAESTLVSH
jgi:hypothetical protein